MTAAYVAVETAAGPHVTPVTFTRSQCALWFGAARGSVKVRALERNPAVGVLFPRGDHAVMVSGTAELTMVAPDFPWAAASYAARNGPFLAGYALDVVSGRAALPLDRMFVRVPIKDWVAVSGRESIALRVRLPLDMSPPFEGLLGDHGHAGRAVFGWQTSRGPVAAPARWDAEARIVHVAADALAATPPLVLGRACLTIDRPGPRPSGVAGVMLRGEVTFEGEAGCLAVDRTTGWRGFESITSRVA